MTDFILEENLNSSAWFFASIVDAFPGLLYFIDAEKKVLASNHVFKEQVDSDDKKIDYEKIAKLLNLDLEERDTIAEDDYSGFFNDKREESDFLVKRDGQEPKYYKIYRQAIKGEDNKTIVGLLVMIQEQVPPHEEIIKAEAQKVEIKLDRAPRVLVVEDSDLAQTYNRRIFEKNHCKVDVAGNEKEALALFGTNTYDLILMDLGLPDSPGRIVTKHIREKEALHGSTKKVPVIALTTKEAENVLSDCKYYQMNGYIKKPIRKSQAAQLIEHYIYNKDVKVDDMIALDEA